MKIKYWIILFGLVLFGIALLVLRPVPIPDEKDCLIFKGTVTEIYEGGVKDVVFKFRGQKRIFYVNRGLQRGLDLQELKEELTYQEILIKYPDYWTLLDPYNSIIHISKIEFKGRTLFTELD